MTASSTVAKLENGMLQALAKELSLTICALNDRPSNEAIGGEALGRDALNVHGLS